MSLKPRSYEKHGGTYTRAYRIWWDMLRRCLNSKSPQYERYGGRGIGVCREWTDSFGAFLRDMGAPPPGLTLERKDNSNGYSKDNCRWASRWEQSINRDDTISLTIGGVTKPLAAWAKEQKLPYVRVYYRKAIAGWDDAACLGPPKKLKVLLNYAGRSYTVKDIAKLAGISVNSVHLRVKAGWPIEEIINRPNSQPYKKSGWRFTTAHAPGRSGGACGRRR